MAGVYNEYNHLYDINKDTLYQEIREKVIIIRDEHYVPFTYFVNSCGWIWQDTYETTLPELLSPMCKILIGLYRTSEGRYMVNKYRVDKFNEILIEYGVWGSTSILYEI